MHTRQPRHRELQQNAQIRFDAFDHSISRSTRPGLHTGPDDKSASRARLNTSAGSAGSFQALNSPAMHSEPRSAGGLRVPHSISSPQGYPRATADRTTTPDAMVGHHVRFHRTGFPSKSDNRPEAPRFRGYQTKPIPTRVVQTSSSVRRGSGNEPAGLTGGGDWLPFMVAAGLHCRSGRRRRRRPGRGRPQVRAAW